MSDDEQESVTSTLALTKRVDELAAAIQDLKYAVAQLSDELHKVADDVKRVMTRLVGDDLLGGDGLITELEDRRLETNSLTTRVNEVEEKLKTGKIALYSLGGILSLFGGLIAWIKTTEFFRWLGKE